MEEVRLRFGLDLAGIMYSRLPVKWHSVRLVINVFCCVILKLLLLLGCKTQVCCD